MKRFPRDSGPLVDMRKRGSVPELPVLVSFVGPLEFNNVTLRGDVTERYDWRPLAGLNVEVFASAELPLSALIAELVDIAEVVPQTMVLTFQEGPRVHCGEWRGITDFRLFDWFPMAVGPKSYAEGTKLAKALWAQMGKSIPVPYDEACDLAVKVAIENSRKAA